jgi:hypothetical protein
VFYDYSQNNSGGSFVYEPERGISHWVIVEADSASEANARAERIGLYFDGEGDCRCCGDRWYEQSSYETGDETPSAYGAPVTDGMPGLMRWIDGYEGFIHYADGRVEGIWPVPAVVQP